MTEPQLLRVFIFFAQGLGRVQLTRYKGVSPYLSANLAWINNVDAILTINFRNQNFNLF